MSGIVISLHRSPIVSPPPVFEFARMGPQFTAPNRLNPRGMPEPEPLAALHKSMPLVVITLYRRPVIHPLGHVSRLSNIRSQVNAVTRASLRECKGAGAQMRFPY